MAKYSETWKKRDENYDKLTIKGKKPLKALTAFGAKKSAATSGKSASDVSLNEFIIVAILEKIGNVGISSEELIEVGFSLDQVKMIHESIDVLGILGIE